MLLPPCLLITLVQQPGTSSPPSWLKHSFVGIIWMCRASFTNSSCPLPWSSTVVSFPWFSHACSTTAMQLLHHPPLPDISVFFQFRLQSQFGLSDVDLAATAGDTLPQGSVSFTLVNIERRVHPDLKTTLMLNFLQTHLMSSPIPAT